MKFVLAQNIAVRFHARRLSANVMASRADAVAPAGILVDPIHLLPFSRNGFVRRDELEAFRVCARWMTKLLHMARQQKIERFDLIDIFLSDIETFQAIHDGGAADRYASDCR